ncbi:MAG: galactokinase [Bacteroidales bacterium]|nr:galactokinase [Bacteroidales bacterium]MBR1571029.1 galactokinase [Bacteroidales bacterium]
MKTKIQEKFKSLFGEEGDLYTSAGRINLIGEHTDYNGGYVFPGAINFGIMAAIKPNGTNKAKVFAIDRDEYVEFFVDEESLPQQLWPRYIYGVCREIVKRGGKVEGFNAVFAGDVPLGAGLSSSAALESTFAFALNDLFNGNSIEKFELARIGQSTEHNYCGVKCGIMDQFASIFGKEGSLMRLNCKTGEYKYFPFHPKGYRVVLIDTCVKHLLADSAYNKRRESCERAAEAIRKNHPEVEFLSDAKRVWLDEVRGVISEEDFIRAEYVIGEVQRVLDVCDALERDDYETVGEMMYQTHFGLSHLYEVSCEELDFLNKLARKCDVTGSRVMGGGFGGCTINLVKEELYDRFIETAVEKFNEKFGHEPKIYNVVISDGARKL